MAMEQLKTYYQAEKHALSQALQEFAALNPAAASQLQIQSGVSHDPLLSQLLDAFALMASRLQYKHHQDTQQLYSALLNLVFPLLNKPLPAMAIVQLTPPADLALAATIPRDTLLTTAGADGIELKTCYDVTLYPLALTGCQWRTRFDLPKVISTTQAHAELSIDLSNRKTDSRFVDLQLDSLEFYCNTDATTAAQLLEALRLSCVGIALCLDDHEPIALPLSALELDVTRPALCQAADNVDSAEQILLDYMTFAAQAHFFRLVGLKDYLHQSAQKKLRLQFYFREDCAHFTDLIIQQALQLFCTPTRNTLAISMQPIVVDDLHYDYLLSTTETAQVDVRDIISVKASKYFSSDPLASRPYFAAQYGDDNSDCCAYWYAKDSIDHGAHAKVIQVSVKGDFPSEGMTLDVTCDCLQKNAAERLLAANGKLFYKDAKQEADYSARVLRAVQAAKWPRRHAEKLPQLLQSLWHARSLLEQADPTQALKQLLHVYQSLFTTSDYAAAIHAVTVLQQTKRHPDPLRYGFVMGYVVQVTLDEDYLAADDTLLFAKTLSQYFKAIAPINSFIELVCVSRERGHLFHWQDA